MYKRLDLIKALEKSNGAEWIKQAKSPIYKLTALAASFKEPRISPTSVEFSESRVPDLVPFDSRVTDHLEKKIGIEWDENTKLIAADCWSDVAIDALLTKQDWFTVANHLVYQFRTSTAKRVLVAANAAAAAASGSTSKGTVVVTPEVGSKLLYTLFERAPNRDSPFYTVSDKYNPISRFAFAVVRNDLTS